MNDMENAIAKIRANWAAGDEVRDAGLTVPEDIVCHTDLRYGPHPENLLDVYYPVGTEKKLPTIISIHGGGWCYGSKERYSHYCLRLAERGFTVVNFDYRLAPEHKYPAPVEDCCNVLAWVQANAEKYHIDLNNLFLVGDSAGGQLAFQLLTMLNNEKYRKLFPFAPPEGIRFRACGLNGGCYFMPVSRMVPPQRAGKLFEAYFPEDYMPCVPSLQTHKYVKKGFPPAFITTSPNDYLRMMAPPLHMILRMKGVKSVLKIYGEKSRKDIGHVFHLNCRLEEANRCNDDQCAFFREHMAK
jgi:acetyl esterase/lipase